MAKAKSKTNNVRARIAPSPTGLLHVGTARTALFNYLFARQNKGVFILRIEDTDKKRSKKEFEKNIIEGLNWLGINYDEGPEREGELGPYYQSKRKRIYQKYVKQLIDKNRAYYCFCSTEELKKERKKQREQGRAPVYSGKCRGLAKEQVEKKLKAKKPFIVRFKAPQKKVVFEDMLRGRIETDTSAFGDFSIAKGEPASGRQQANQLEPLYNLACVIDDYEMKISHVIRGEDHIPNTPKQILIFEALGIEPPQYLHLPLILAPDKSKLSKRHGAVSVIDYKKQGYLSEAMVNFLALLGWNPGTNEEVFSMKELVEKFSLKKIQKSGAVFNLEKLDWLNGHYIRKMNIEQLTQLCAPYLIKQGFISPVWGREEVIPLVYSSDFGIKEFEITETKEKIKTGCLKKVISLYQERLKKLSEIGGLTDYLFREPKYEKDLLKWKNMTEEGLKSSLEASLKALESIKEPKWTLGAITQVLMDIAPQGSRGEVLWPLRAALSGKKASAPPFDIAFVLGKEKTLKRIKKALAKV